MRLSPYVRINDRYGHMAGDEYLKQLGVLIRNTLRDQDIAGRIGGEEFLIILPETGADGAVQLAVRLRQYIEKFVMTYREAAIRTTISAGVCQYEKGIKEVREFLDLADQALYEAKKSEKNKVISVSLADRSEK